MKKMISKEEAWFNRLKRVINDMPNSIEIIVKQNSIEAAQRGATIQCLRETGCVDNIPTLPLGVIINSNIVPNGECL